MEEAIKATSGLHDLEFSVEKLKQYFKFLFPSQKMFQWLTYFQPNIIKDNDKKEYSDYFYKREFSFTFEGNIYKRYNCYPNEKEFKTALIETTPIKIDIGAVYNMAPKNHSSIEGKGFVPLEKELVFDIDMTDYNDVRTCCKDKTVCKKWWKFIVVAVKIIDWALRDDFGYENLLWVFSGRRGVHWWVWDASARKLTMEARTAIANYLTVHIGNDMTSGTASIKRPLHPSIERASEIIENYFEEVMWMDQNILADETQRNKLYSMLRLKEGKEVIEFNKNDFTDYDNPENSVGIWRVFCKAAEKDSKGNCHKESAMLTFLYPRLDANVSKGLNHLLKSPFCVHPDTGKICIPFDPKNVDNFDPNTSPTLSQALEEYDIILAKDKNSTDKVMPWMKESLAVFDDFLDGVLKEYKAKIIKEKRKMNDVVVPMEIEEAF